MSTGGAGEQLSDRDARGIRGIMYDKVEASCWTVAVRAVFIFGAILVVASYLMGADATQMALR